MKNKCSYGHDLLSNIMIKKAHDPLIKPLTLLINQSLSSGVLVSTMKTIKMTCNRFMLTIPQRHTNIRRYRMTA